MAVNKLDALINEQLLSVNMAVKTLQAMGLSVNSISIDDNSSRPVILITPGHACRTLQSAYTKRLIRSGRRIVERVAFVADCQVKWEEISA